jgi:hypothetical protein
MLEAFRATFSRRRERVESFSAILALVIHYGLAWETLSEIYVVGKILLKACGDLLYLLAIQGIWSEPDGWIIVWLSYELEIREVEYPILGDDFVVARNDQLDVDWREDALTRWVSRNNLIILIVDAYDKIPFKLLPTVVLCP